MSYKKFWDRIAMKIGYDHSHIKKKIVGNSGEDRFKKNIIDHAHNSKVLDIGCADGLFSLEIAKKAKYR